eukprot:10249726-Karenia_brevis.AAC.1
MDSLRNTNSRRVAGHLNPFAMFASAVSIKLPDVSIWELPVFGGPPVGPLKPFGIFRKKMHPAERLPEELLKDADAW